MIIQSTSFFLPNIFFSFLLLPWILVPVLDLSFFPVLAGHIIFEDAIGLACFKGYYIAHTKGHATQLNFNDAFCFIIIVKDVQWQFQNLIKNCT